MISSEFSIICWPTLTTSITPIRAAKELVLIMRVNKLIEPGKTRRTLCGSSMKRNTCQRLKPMAKPDST